LYSVIEKEQSAIMDTTDVAKILLKVYEKASEAENRVQHYEEAYPQVGGDDNSVSTTFQDNVLTNVKRSVFSDCGDVTINVQGNVIFIDNSEVHFH